MATGEQLKKLLSAFRDRDDSTFYRVADQIIADELAANHHALARDLKRALGSARQKQGDLVLLRDKRFGQNLLHVDDSDTTSDELVLADRTERQISRVLEEHRSASKLSSYGYQPKRKLLFWGPPGCGKTMAAHLIAHELGLPIGTVRISALISSYLGDTATHLETVFDTANKQPIVLLLDEVDAVGKTRDDRQDVGEVKRVVNSLLQSMDAFTKNKSIVIAASNHQYLLDAALWRRFDDVIEFPLPGSQEIAKYLHKLLNGVRAKITFSRLAKSMLGFSFADIEKIAVEAVKTMILEGRENLTERDLTTELKMFVNAGAARKPKGDARL